MIYLRNHKFTQTAYVPKVTDDSRTALSLVLRSEIDRTEVRLEVVDEQVSRLNYLFTFNLPEGMQDGEYTYRVEADGLPVAQGMAMLVSREMDIEEYNKNTEYEQYES